MRVIERIRRSGPLDPILSFPFAYSVFFLKGRQNKQCRSGVASVCVRAGVRLSICPSLSTAPGTWSSTWMNAIRCNTLEMKCQHIASLQLWLSFRRGSLD